MARSPQNPKAKRKVIPTLLIVGEGRHEEAFIKHVRRLFVPRDGGLRVTIKQAGGKGAEHVVEWACRQMKNVDYDRVAVLLDTDEGWSVAVRKNAKAKKIELLLSQPRLEAMLLRVLGVKPQEGVDGHAHKSQFAPYVNGDPTDAANYTEHFTPECLMRARSSEQAIDTLLKLLGV